MKLIYRDTAYDLPEPHELVRPEASFIKEQTGLTLRELGDALKNVDLDAVCAYLYIAKKRAGEKVRWSDFDDTSLSDFEWGSTEDKDDQDDDAAEPVDDEPGEGGEPDPT